MKRHHSQGRQFQTGTLSTQNFQLEQILGMTVQSAHQMDINAKTHELAYTAGSTVVVYSPASNRQVKYFNAKAQVFAVKFSLDGTMLFAGEGACKLPAIHIWDLATSNLILSMRGHKVPIALTTCSTP